MNFAALRQLPLIVVCENNQYAVETAVTRATAVDGTIAERASGFGLPAVQVDGQDVCAVYRATREAHQRAVAGGGPTFIEALTYRYYGHNTGEVPNYRSQDEVEPGAPRRTRSSGSGARSSIGQARRRALRCPRREGQGDGRRCHPLRGGVAAPRSGDRHAGRAPLPYDAKGPVAR